MFFSAANRERILAENPNFGVTDVAKALGEAWKTVSDAEKEVFQQQADEDKARYEGEMAAYTRAKNDDDGDDDVKQENDDVDAMDED